MLALAIFIATQVPVTADFERVLGATIGSDSPAVLEAVFGSRSRVVRHYWSEQEKCYVRDDGWNWWSWPEANAFVQIYWTPAYPASKRRIETITICMPFGKAPPPKIAPSPSRLGWLTGIRLGMVEETCLRILRHRFGAPKKQFGQWVWNSNRATLTVACDKGRLIELDVTATNRQP